jgi:hypothetical protein
MIPVASASVSRPSSYYHSFILVFVMGIMLPKIWTSE